MARQLELEKATLLEKKRREQDERRRKQEELDQILLENRRKARTPHILSTISSSLRSVHRVAACNLRVGHRHVMSPGRLIN